LVVRRPTREDAEVIRRLEQMRREMKVPRLTQKHIWFDVQGKRIRAVGGTVYMTPSEKPFHEYLVDDVLLSILGDTWYEGEMQKPLEQRHAIALWRGEILQEARRRGATLDKAVRIPLTGNTKALLVLADDAWQLAQTGGIPKRMRARLGHYAEFQGVRYELAIGAAFVRAGFRLDFIRDPSARAPEFVATHRANGERVAVEVKSLRRAGVLHEGNRSGHPPDEVHAKVSGLLSDALSQLANVDCPALVFVDLNLPLTPGVPTPNKPWFADLKTAVRSQLDNRTSLPPQLVAVVVTNFGWHYYRDIAGGDGEYVVFHLPNDRARVTDETWALVDRALSEYGFIPDPERHQQAVKARYPEFSGPTRGIGA